MAGPSNSGLRLQPSDTDALDDAIYDNEILAYFKRLREAGTIDDVQRRVLEASEAERKRRKARWLEIAEMRPFNRAELREQWLAAAIGTEAIDGEDCILFDPIEAARLFREERRTRKRELERELYCERERVREQLDPPVIPDDAWLFGPYSRKSNVSQRMRTDDFKTCDR